jgi:hypothetical protein
MADEPQVGQWHEDVERKQKYYHIIIFPERNKKRRGQVKTTVTEHFNDILFHKSGSANKQHTNHSFSTFYDSYFSR